MDWFDHPEKTREWYEERRARYEKAGLLHVFKQEIDRDPTASLEGILINGDWVKASIDAHKVLNFDTSGKHCAGFDPFDDTNRNAWHHHFPVVQLRRADQIVYLKNGYNSAVRGFLNRKL